MHLNLVSWLVIGRESHDLASSIGWHASSTVSSVADVAHIIDNESHDSAWATSIDVAYLELLAFSKFKEKFLGFFESIFDRLDWLLWKVVILDDKLMQVVSKEVSAYMPTMTIVNAKEWAFGPLAAWKLLRLWLHNVQDYGDAIFIVVANYTLVRIGSVSCNDAITLGWILGNLVVRHQLPNELRSAFLNFLSNCLVEVLSYLCMWVRSIMISFWSFDSIIDQACWSKLKTWCRETLLSVEKARCALTSTSKLAKTLSSIIATPTDATWRLESVAQRLGHLRQRYVLSWIQQFGQSLITELGGIHDILRASFKVKMRPVWLYHLHDQVIILAVDIQEKFKFLVGLLHWGMSHPRLSLSAVVAMRGLVTTTWPAICLVFRLTIC